MVWYADGSIEVAANGQVATGTGTVFLKNVRVGDGITIEGSAAQHEVTNIASDTQLAFAPPFAGPAGAGKAYRIVPTQGYVKEAADRLWAITQSLGGFATSQNLQSIAQLEGQAGQVLRFKSPGEIEAILLGTASAKNATSSATDKTPDRAMLTGLGGWMGDIPSGGLSDLDDRTIRGWRYVTETTVGAKPAGLTYGIVNTFGSLDDVVVQELYSVSGAAGATLSRYYRQTYGSGAWGAWVQSMRSDAIEGGSNANGRYVKFPDGTLICSHTPPTVVVSPAVAPGSSTPLYSTAFPAEFVSPPTCISSGSTAANAENTLIATIIPQEYNGTSGWATAFLVVGSVALGRLTRSHLAIGRWK
nr:hypothetical protein [uncultured Pseudomonas sp.]